MSNFQVILADWNQWQPQLHAIRREVFVREQGVPEEDEWDEKDAIAIHLLAFVEEEITPVGTVRLLPNGKITRMAVLQKHRGKGVGAALLHQALVQARTLGLNEVHLDAQVSSLGFYSKYGFTATGETFLDAGIPHKSMRLTLGGDPMNETDVIRLEHPSDVLPLMREFAGMAQRSIDIFTHQLNPALYDDEQLLDSVSRLARRGPQTQIRILIRDPRPLYGNDRPILTLSRRLPSHIHLRVYTEGASDARFGFLCVDAEHLLHFTDEPALTGFARRGARAESRQRLDEFEHLWVYGSRQDTNLRQLSL